jgi:hypothetical protein
VPIVTGAGVSPAVSYLDVEPGPALLHSAGRVDCLHYGGGCVLFYWAPISGNTPTSGASVTKGCVTSNNWLEILFGAEIYVQHCREHWGNGCPNTLLHNNDDCESLWVSGDAADQWWPADCDGETVGQ